MSKIKMFFTTILLIVCVGAVLLSPVAQAQLGLMLAPMQANGLFLAIIAAPIILVLITAFLVGQSNARAKKRERDQHNPDAQSPNAILTPAKNVVDTESASIAPEITDKQNAVRTMTPFSVIIGGKSSKLTKPEPIERTAPEPAVTDEPVYFQPVMEMKSGDIAYYEIFRKQQKPGGNSYRFIQFSNDDTEQERAAFEYALIRSALKSIPQIISPKGHSHTRLILPVSLSLLTHDQLWAELSTCLEAHHGQAKNLMLMVHLRANSSEDAKRLNTIKDQLEKIDATGIQLGINCELRHLSVIDGSVKDMFAVVGATLSQLMQQSDLRKKPTFDFYCTNITSESDIVDGLAAGAAFMRGDYVAKPLPLKANTASNEPLITSTGS